MSFFLKGTDILDCAPAFDRLLISIIDLSIRLSTSGLVGLPGALSRTIYVSIQCILSLEAPNPTKAERTDRPILLGSRMLMYST